MGPDPRRELPAGFYFQNSMVAALAAYDFAVVFRRVRAVTGWSQQTLGDLVGLDQTRISEIERGQRRLRDVALVARVVTGLRIPPVLLGFGTTVGEEEIADPQVVSWVDRRDFVQHIAALTVGVTGVAGLDIDRLIALLPQADPTGTRHVGASDVEVIEQATAAFVRQDFATGAGPVRDVAVAQLRSVLPLLGAQVTDEVRPRLYLATARLAMQAAATTCSLVTIQARAYAARGDAAACDRALGQAIEHFNTIDPATSPPWGAHVGDTGISARQGAAHYALALTGRDPRAAERAVPLLRYAVDHFGPDYARALYLPDLAGAHAIAGDTDTAVTVGHQAVDAVTAVSSPRAYDRLRVLNTVLQSLHDSAGVAELRGRLAATAA